MRRYLNALVRSLDPYLQLIFISAEGSSDEGHLREIPDGEELPRGGIDKHPLSVEIKPAFAESRMIDFKAAA